MLKKNLLYSLILLFFAGTIFAQKDVDVNTPGAGNPILPGWFADPTIKKFGDIYYIYATTDNEMLASGAPTVWYSKDFKNWYNYIMEIPSFSAKVITNFWAPDIIEGDDGKYYLYFGNCEIGCNIYGYVSDSPVGPWKKLSDQDVPVISNGYPRENFPSLDAQFFKDTDGKIYGYWGTWVHYNGGYAVGELNKKNMSGMMNSANIPLAQTPAPFEAAYMMKKGSKYILMYSGASCHDETYNVRYSYSNSPYGPFTPGKNNPILSTNENQTVHGPGHHSVLQEKDDYYIVYHKHDYPMTRGGLARQVCIDKMIFENDSTIKTVVPSNKGIEDLVKSEVPENIAFKAKTTASSFYHLKSTQYDYQYQPSYATDDNNATMWKAADNTTPQDLIVDLGSEKKIKRIMTQFEFASYYYQYKLEYSLNGKNWNLYSDKSKNRTAGSPMIDDNDVTARYIKLTVLATEKTGLYAAVWNIKIYSSLFDLPLKLKNTASKIVPAVKSTKKLLVDLDAGKISDLNAISNKGSIGGIFTKSGDISLEKSEGIKAFHFKNGAFTLNKSVPKSLAWNGSYTVAAWVKNPEIANEGEIIVSWCDRTEFGLANSYNALAYNSGSYGAGVHLDGHFDMKFNKIPEANKWHYIVLTFDGVVEKIYVDSILDNSQNMLLSSAIDKAKIIIGASDIGENFSGFIASLRMYDYALNQEDLLQLMKQTQPKKE
ncbi:family 43 glycosylhydrolase [Flavobacterium pectinovorum]|uniref:Concanavalin A-like lectin/glucanases superfamily protein n=1 Tax=Flavobacterium pectinovorum TaxID=29533 RepID=A0AB36P0E6_9FLAO|nr:family 43 glycosylhydrolase [Flavobacterium pectinovorum]OXB04607.1 glycoside hydrolase [Flavobacterium pectinovorum]SHL23506.1 Concanavalin A-like lectin/glucanases superfamily protein [Flavobacterium pectinovorum]